MPDWPAIRNSLQRYGVRVTASQPLAVGGGDISAAWCARADSRDVFLKTGAAAAIDMFAAEAAGLGELRQAGAVRVPEVIACDTAGPHAYLALEWLALEQPTAAVDEMLGRQLAAQHRHCAGQFGWHRDNTIGATPQANAWCGDWAVFFRRQRLAAQLRLAASNGFTGELQTAGAALSAGLERLLAGHQPPASLLHGDLWSGNRAACQGQPVIYDPAVYYGDRESDIAMARLFGGFSKGFYRAYEACWPLAVGHERRTQLYQLYHVLNHLNLFGGAYLGRALDLMQLLDRAIRESA